MKKNLCRILTIAMISVFCLAGCGSGDPDAESGSGSAADGAAEQNQGQETKQGYVFEVNGVTISVDADMDALKSSLGEPKSTFDAPSCAGEGISYVYGYGAYEIETYPEGEKNLIGRITLKDDTVATAEKIDLSKTKTDVISAYGDDYTETDNSITYSRGNMKLTFMFNGEDIASIEYVSNVMG